MLVDENAGCRRLEIGEQELEALLFEIISKQAQVILNTGCLDSGFGLAVKVEQQVDYEKQINKCQAERCELYEKYVLGEPRAEAYKEKKAGIDTEHSRLKRALDALKAETAVMSAAEAAEYKLKNVAEAALGSDKLTRPVVDLLIEKVFVFPDNHIEIVWKTADFSPENGIRKRYVKQANSMLS
jgi:hypothetical protein